MRANPFESQLERLARTLTEQFGVKVVCQGDNAWTDGRQIVLPSMPEPMDDGLERMMIGYLDHEMAHVAFSDFQVAAKFEKKHPGRLGILNVVEDALIERRAMHRWPGVRANLDAMFAQVRPRIAALIARRGPFDRFCTAIYLKLAHYRDMLGLDREIAGYEDLLDGFPGIKKTREASDLAEALLSRWLSKHQQRNGQPKPGNGGPPQSNQRGTEEQQPGNGKPEGSASEPPPDVSSAPGSSGEPSPDKDSSSGNEANDDRQSEGGGTAGGNPKDSLQEGPNSAEAQAGAEPDEDAAPRQSSADGGAEAPEGDTPLSGAPVSAGQGGGGTLIGEALREAIRESVAQMSASTDYRVFTKQYDHIDVLPPADDAATGQLLAEGGDTVRRLRRGLANALRSAEKRWWQDSQSRGELSPRTLYRLCMDRPSLDVFRRRSMVQGRATAVCVILDASGSMTSRKMDVARQAMRVLLEALGDLRIAAEAFTFTTGDKFSLSQAIQQTGLDHSRLQERFSRFGNLEIGLIKGYEEPVKAGLARLPSVRGSGLTPLGEAMQIGASRIVSRPEFRRIMLVLTDGKAGCESGEPSAGEHARTIACRISQAGIELVGVGIQDDSLGAIVKNTIVIQVLQDLPAQLCNLLGRTLKKGVCRVG